VKLSHAFEVPASPAATLRVLLDPERVVPCMPGAQLTEAVDERTWKSTMSVRLGPVGMDFTNLVRLVEVDEAAGRVRMEASGRESRGKGAAQADILAALDPIDAGTRVEITMDLRFSGQAAQLGRPNVVQDISSRLVAQFAECLRAQLSTAPAEAQAAVDRSQKPISGLSLLIATTIAPVRRLLGRGQHQAKAISAFGVLVVAVVGALSLLLRRRGHQAKGGSA
jgi:carbon monoxide dehydrogenase subunit G